MKSLKRKAALLLTMILVLASSMTVFVPNKKTDLIVAMDEAAGSFWGNRNSVIQKCSCICGNLHRGQLRTNSMKQL